jgi:hypothetical protein
MSLTFLWKSRTIVQGKTKEYYHHLGRKIRPGEIIMLGKNLIGFIVATAIISNAFGALMIATTDDGKKVLLRDDGTWKLATQSDVVAVKMMKPNSADAATASAPSESQADEPGNPRVQMKSQGSDEPERAGFLDVVKGDKTFDIRKAMWGMEKADVKKTEALQLIKENQNSLEYKFKLIGLDSKILYKFSADKSGKLRLSGAQYVIEQDDVNPAKFYDDYKSLRGYLRQLYGFPVSDENAWTNEMYKADEKNWGFAVSLGFLTCHAVWKNTRTKIALNISGSNHILSTNIEYFNTPQ